MNFKLELQKQANRWNSILHDMIKGGRTEGTVFGEYRGKIYAVRHIAEMLGIEIDARFPWEWFDEHGNSIEPEYDYR